MPPLPAFALDTDFLASLHDRLTVPTEVAVVGAGRWAKVLCTVLTTFSPSISRIVLVAERNAGATQQWLDEQLTGPDANGHGRIAVTSRLGDVLESRRVEAAFVTKMASEHFDATRALLLAGKHVLVEKPFVLSAAEAHELTDLAKTRQRTLAVGYEFMYAADLHHLRAAISSHLADVVAVEFIWEDTSSIVKWGVRKQPDLSANIVTDLYPHVLSQLLILFGRHDIELRRLQSRDGCSHAAIECGYGSIAVHASLDKNAPRDRRSITAISSSGSRLTLDFTSEPGQLELDGRPLAPDRRAEAFPRTLTAEIAYFFAQIQEPNVMIPNTAEQTVHVVEATERANAELVARQAHEIKNAFWQPLPEVVPDAVQRILRHQMLGGLLSHGLVANPKDIDALDRWVGHIFRIAHRFSRDPWATQADIMTGEGLDAAQLIALNAAMRESDFLQNLIVREGLARQYWSTILPLVETNSIDAVLTNRYQFPLRLGIYAAVSCMFSCTFCGRMENPDARYSHGDVTPGNEIFDQVFAAMPKGISTLSLGGGLEPLTNPRLDDVIRSAKGHGHKVPLVTNGYMLTPHYVKRHEALWDVDVLRISLYGVDEPSYANVTKKPGAFQIVKNNVIEFLKERQRRGAGPRVGFNFIILVNTTGEVLQLLDLIAEINAAVPGQGIDFLTLREDFSIREGDGLTLDERQSLVDIFQQFHDRRRAVCPDLSVDFGYALYPLSQGMLGQGLAMVRHDKMLPKAYPQVSVALDLLGDVYLYRDAAFPDRPGADRYKIGTITKSRPLELIVREFLDAGKPIVPLANDTWIMDAFDHVVTNLVWQGRADHRSGIPFQRGPIKRRAHDRKQDAGGHVPPTAVNYWQGLFGA